VGCGLNWLAKAEQQCKFHAHVYYLRGIVQLHRDAVDAALISLRQAIYCDPKFALAHYALADLHEKRGDLKEAKRSLKLAQAAIAGQEPDQPIDFEPELTAAMLQELLVYRLKRLSA
jgi:Tfp pilus assembly protein PilF